MLEQPQKLKADVSIWQLIVAPQKHRQLLIEALNKIEVSLEATPEEMITSITAGKGTINFSSEHLPSRGAAHNNSLYLNATQLQKHVPLALVDNGLTVNTCPWRTAKRLGTLDTIHSFKGIR